MSTTRRFTRWTRAGMKLILPITLGVGTVAILLCGVACELAGSAAEPAGRPSAGSFLWSTSDELPPAPDRSESEDFWKDVPAAPRRMDRRLRKQLSLLGTFFGLLFLGLFSWAAWTVRTFKKRMPTAAADFAAQMENVQAIAKSSENAPQWFFGSHENHDYAFTVILQRLPRGEGPRPLPRPTLRVVLGVDCKEPLGVTGYRSTTNSPRVRAWGRSLEAKIRRVPTLLTLSHQLFMEEEQANRLSPATQEKMLAFVLEHLSLRIRDRQGTPAIELHPELLKDKQVILGYETWGTQRSLFEFDRVKVRRALDDLVAIAKELEW